MKKNNPIIDLASERERRRKADRPSNNAALEAMLTILTGLVIHVTVGSYFRHTRR